MGQEDIGRSPTGGIDILQLAAAAKESIEAKPPQSIVVDVDTKKPKKRQDKKALLRRNDEPVVKKNDCAKKIIVKSSAEVKKPLVKAISCEHVVDKNQTAKPVNKNTSCEPAPNNTEVASKDGATMMILKRTDVKPNNTNQNNSKPNNNNDAKSKNNKAKKGKNTTNPPKKFEGNVKLQNEISSLQQEITDLKKRLEQEKTSRKSCEANHQKIQNELTSTRQTLEHESQYRKNCQRDMDKLKEELESEREVRVKAQEVEENFNLLISEEKEKNKELSKQLQQEEYAKQILMDDLETIKAQLASEKTKTSSLQEELATAQQLNESLQQKIAIDSASTISIKMELHSMKSRMGKVEELEQSLKQEILNVDRLQNELAKADTIKLELEEAKEKLLRMDNLKMELLLEKSKVQELETKLSEDHTRGRKRSDSIPVNDKSTRSMSNEFIYDDDVDIHVEKLRKELHETREALKNERKKNAQAEKKFKSKTTAEVSSLKDWIDLALPSSAEVSMPPATQVSLSDGPQEKDKTTSKPPPQDHYFDGTKNEFCGDDETSPLEDELTFIMSAYSSEEVVVSDSRDKVTYSISLPTNNDDEVEIEVVVHVPKGYPFKGKLGVDVSIANDSNCSSDMRKCLMDTLPKLNQMCLWEAEGNYGQQALLAVLNMAEHWANSEWPGILSKQFPSFKILQRPKPKEQGSDLYSALIYTHHLIEPEKVQHVKKIASKLSLVGFIKSGKPGVILIASISESDCDIVLNELKSQASHKIFRSTAFKLACKVRKQASGLDSSLTRMTFLDNSKDGMDELMSACGGLGLSEALQDII